MRKPVAALAASVCLALLLGAREAFPSPDAWFDGARAAPAGARPPRFEAPPLGETVALPEQEDGELPEDLRRARERVGIDAQIARLRLSNPEPKTAFTMAVIGDAEAGRFPWERAFPPAKDAFLRQLRSIQGRNPDLVFQLGDFVSRGTVRNFRRFVALLDAESRVPMLLVAGNHDRSRPNGAADKTLYRAVVGEPDFFVDHGGWRLIGLDTSDRRLSAEQLAWLDRTLDTPLRKLVFTHVPPAFLKGAIQYGDPDGALEIQEDGKGYLGDAMNGYFQEGAEEFGRLAARRGVERVYMGHIHAFGVATHLGVPYVLSGGGGSPLYPLPSGYPSKRMAHYLLLELGPEGVRETVVPLDGAEFPLRLR